jgi:DNA polymerase III alpha subunit
MGDQTKLKDRTLFYDGSSSFNTDDIVSYILQYGPNQIYCSESGLGLKTKFKSDSLPEIQWLLPEPYEKRDIESEVLTTAASHGPEAIARVKTEFQEFEKRDMVPLLKLLLYIKERMEEKNKVWGVGRGSSCAVYTFFLMGIHSVDSLKFNLPMDEFFR